MGGVCGDVVLWFAGVATCYWAESQPNPLLHGVDQRASTARRSPGGNMEGKEVRFGIANSALFATVTTDASCGAVNAMHDSLHAAGRNGSDGQHACWARSSSAAWARACTEC